MNDTEKFRREYMRWVILITLYNARPCGAKDALVLSVVRSEFPDCTLHELRREADYLHDRKLVTIKRPPDGSAWACELTRYGVDIVEYSIDCEPGIHCPQKYF